MSCPSTSMKIVRLAQGLLCRWNTSSATVVGAADPALSGCGVRSPPCWCSQVLVGLMMLVGLMVGEVVGVEESARGVDVERVVLGQALRQVCRTQVVRLGHRREVGATRTAQRVDRFRTRDRSVQAYDGLVRRPLARVRHSHRDADGHECGGQDEGDGEAARTGPWGGRQSCHRPEDMAHEGPPAGERTKAKENSRGLSHTRGTQRGVRPGRPCVLG